MSKRLLPSLVLAAVVGIAACETRDRTEVETTTPPPTTAPPPTTTAPVTTPMPPATTDTLMGRDTMHMGHDTTMMMGRDTLRGTTTTRP